jgi:hypothetical protein
MRLEWASISSPSVLCLALWGRGLSSRGRGTQGGRVVREVPSRANSATVAGVDRLDRICGADHAPDLDVVVQERYELAPGVLPELADRCPAWRRTPRSAVSPPPLRARCRPAADPGSSLPNTCERRTGNVLRIRWMMHAWTVASSQVVVIASGRPFRPSQTAMQTSCTPRFLISVNTLSQNFARPHRHHPPRARGCPARRPRSRRSRHRPARWSPARHGP